MRQFLFYAICTALMVCFVLFCKVLVVDISKEFGWGVGVGFFFALILFYFGERAGFKEPRY